MQLHGKKVVIAGGFRDVSRQDIVDFVTSQGAVVTAAVVEDTDLLIYGDGAAVKLKLALSTGVTCFPETLYLQMKEESTNIMSNKKAIAVLHGGVAIAAGLHYQIKSEHGEVSTAYCYENPDMPEGRKIGLGFNIADGGGFLPSWDITKDSSVYMNFGQAVEAAKQGFKVARTGWNGKGMFAYLQPAHTVEATVGEMGSGFDAYKKFRTSWMLKTAQGDIATWSPSGSDSLAEDWVLVV